ncbi:YgfZ/GcvT domain-containing protein [Chthonobacter albigriseus]|uniref:CAF17-like 4Fe-4S cluster assembly/insertion protein YgfZ n=1 Tax=Chthonobacter albigriseus TaxID=1683161 RepID=UPI0015EE4637|nr:folate-binding protein YgfZ [Chthonobacter albigriseus]
MAGPRVAELASRAVVDVSGDDAAALLDRLVTVDTDAAQDEEAAFGALLTPQGKILTDFLLVRNNGGFLIDLPATAASDFVKRLTLYKLRAKVAIADVSDKLAVLAFFDADEPPKLPGRLVKDPRGLGYRGYVAKLAVGPAEAAPGFAIVDEAEFQAHRIGLAVPEAGADYPFADAFPHDVAMDQLSGVDFSKGCYVGQEVVSRMQHRGTARRRPVAIAALSGSLPLPGAEILAGGKPAGMLGSTAGGKGLAIARLDRLKAALDGGEPITAGGEAVSVTLPAWAHYGWPAGGEASE